MSDEIKIPEGFSRPPINRPKAEEGVPSPAQESAEGGSDLVERVRRDPLGHRDKVVIIKRGKEGEVQRVLIDWKNGLGKKPGRSTISGMFRAGSKPGPYIAAIADVKGYGKVIWGEMQSFGDRLSGVRERLEPHERAVLDFVRPTIERRLRSMAHMRAGLGGAKTYLLREDMPQRDGSAVTVQDAVQLWMWLAARGQMRQDRTGGPNSNEKLVQHLKEVSVELERFVRHRDSADAKIREKEANLQKLRTRQEQTPTDGRAAAIKKAEGELVRLQKTQKLVDALPDGIVQYFVRDGLISEAGLLRIGRTIPRLKKEAGPKTVRLNALVGEFHTRVNPGLEGHPLSKLPRENELDAKVSALRVEAYQQMKGLLVDAIKRSSARFANRQDANVVVSAAVDGLTGDVARYIAALSPADVEAVVHEFKSKNKEISSSSAVGLLRIVQEIARHIPETTPTAEVAQAETIAIPTDDTAHDKRQPDLYQEGTVLRRLFGPQGTTGRLDTTMIVEIKTLAAQQYLRLVEMVRDAIDTLGEGKPLSALNPDPIKSAATEDRIVEVMNTFGRILREQEAKGTLNESTAKLSEPVLKKQLAFLFPSAK